MAEPFRVRFVPGVTPGKWLRTWSERMPDCPLVAEPVEEAEQRTVLVSGEADMCFVRMPVDREGLHVIPLYREVPVVVAARDHPVAAFEEVDVADLAGEHLLQPPGDVPEWRDVAEEVRDGTRLRVPPMSTAEAVEVVASGTGIVVVPMSVARLHHRKDVVHRPVSGVAESQVGLAWLVENEDPRVETFIGIVRGRTGESSRGEGGAQGRRTAARGSERGASGERGATGDHGTKERGGKGGRAGKGGERAAGKGRRPRGPRGSRGGSGRRR